MRVARRPVDHGLETDCLQRVIAVLLPKGTAARMSVQRLDQSNDRLPELGRTPLSNGTITISHRIEPLIGISNFRWMNPRGSPTEILPHEIAIITPYAGQVKEAKKQLRELDIGTEAGDGVQVCSVDGFQGTEKEIIILSLVRADLEKRSIGFIGDAQRMNVALTRARNSMFVLGHAEKLHCNELWNGLIEHCQQVPAKKGGRGYAEVPVPAAYRSERSKGKPEIQVEASARFHGYFANQCRKFLRGEKAAGAAKASSVSAAWGTTKAAPAAGAMTTGTCCNYAYDLSDFCCCTRAAYM